MVSRRHLCIAPQVDAWQLITRFFTAFVLSALPMRRHEMKGASCGAGGRRGERRGHNWITAQ